MQLLLEGLTSVIFTGIGNTDHGDVADSGRFEFEFELDETAPSLTLAQSYY